MSRMCDICAIQWPKESEMVDVKGCGGTMKGRLKGKDFDDWEIHICPSCNDYLVEFISNVAAAHRQKETK